MRLPGQLRQTEIENLHLAALRDNDIRGLDIAMRDAGLMRAREAARNLRRDLDGTIH